MLIILFLTINISTLRAEVKTDFFEVSAYPKSLVAQNAKTFMVTFSDLSANYYASKEMEQCLSLAIKNSKAVIIKHHKKTLFISECKLK